MILPFLTTTILAREDVDGEKEWAKSASVQHEVPEVTDEVLQGTPNPGKLESGQMGIRWREIQM